MGQGESSGELTALLPSLTVLANRSKRRWSVVFAIAAIAAIIGIFWWQAADSGDSGPRAVTSDEASRLATARFRNFESRVRAVTITVPDPAGGLVVTGSVDYRQKAGYGVVKGRGRNDSGDGLIRWTATRIELLPLPAAPARAPAAPPMSGWAARPLTASAGSLDRALSIALGLGADRPDNAQLLPQNGASWIAADQVNGRPVDIFTGPESRDRGGLAQSVRYWLDRDGLMQRVQAAIPEEADPVVIDFGIQEPIAVPTRPNSPG